MMMLDEAKHESNIGRNLHNKSNVGWGCVQQMFDYAESIEWS